MGISHSSLRSSVPSHRYPNSVRHVRVTFIAITSSGVNFEYLLWARTIPNHQACTHTHTHSTGPSPLPLTLLRTSSPTSQILGPLSMWAAGGLTLSTHLASQGWSDASGTLTNTFFSIGNLYLRLRDTVPLSRNHAKSAWDETAAFLDA